MNDFDHPDVSEIELTKVLSALGDPVRLNIVNQLARSKKETNYADLVCDVRKATLSHHIKTLRLAGLIYHRREGTRCFLSLREDCQKLFPGLLKSVLSSIAL